MFSPFFDMLVLLVLFSITASILVRHACESQNELNRSAFSFVKFDTKSPEIVNKDEYITKGSLDMGDQIRYGGFRRISRVNSGYTMH